jgi:hypothetical protein
VGERHRRSHWPALLWLGPSLLLIAAVVLYPAVALVRASLARYSITGLYQGFVGMQNYVRLLEQPALFTVVVNNFMAGGGDNYDTLGRGRDRTDTGITVRSVLEDFVRAQCSAGAPLRVALDGRITRAGDSARRDD